ncbi:MAG: hypothetical protein IIA33_09415 [Planctomycetes bacterium]|nr:hypothetical protein [Planctomycetota bacterium]
MKRYDHMRTFRITAVVALCIAGGVFVGGLACSSSSQDGADQSKGGESARASADLVAQVNAILQLRSSDVVTLVIDETPTAAATVNLPIAGEQYTLDLHPQSVRAANYQVKVQLADGSLVDAEPGPVRTLRGTVVGVEGSAVAASMEEDGLHARIFLSDDEQYWVEPVASRVPQAGPNHYVIYNNDDIIAPQKTCGLDDLPDALGNRGVLGTVRQTRAGACGTGLCIAELAVDADVEYYQDYNSSVAAVESRINLVINAVNLQYDRDVDITHALTTIIVRTAEPDPYTHTNATQLIYQLRDHWLANHSDIERDTVQLFTGRNLGGSTIGIAWLNAVCTQYGFSIVQSDYTNNFGCTTDLTAHELGHNWGADHCSCTSNTMNAYITCANLFHPTSTIPEINAFRDTRSCLDGAAGCTTDDDCDDGDLCTDDTCSSGSCSNTPMDCSDTDPCTADICVGGVCENNLLDCDDLDACTTDTCDSGTCSNVPSVICDDGDDCNGVETCDPDTGSCLAGTPVDCDDNNLCTADSCSGGKCSNVPSVNCDDSDACTTDTCDPANGSCSSSVVDCDDGDSCTTDTCDPSSGCVNNFSDCGLDDGCCGPDCDSTTDNDCDPPPPNCQPKNAACSSDADCCSNKCRNDICRGN